MSQDVLETPAPPAAQAPAPGDTIAPLPLESPPPADQPARGAEPDPRTRLHQLAAELMRTRSRRVLIEFLQLRRALR